MLSNVDISSHHPPIGLDGTSWSGRRPGVVDRRQSIVVGVDFSGPSHRALARAAEVARTHDTKLHVLHAAPAVTTAVDGLLRDNRALERARDELARITARIGATGLVVRPHLSVGGVTRALRSVALELRASLIVVGVRRRLLPDAIVGSTAERVAAATDKPVLVVRRAVRQPYRHLIVALDPSSDPKQLLAAARLAAPSAERSVLHAYEDPYENGLLLDGASHARLRTHRREARREARERLMGIVAAAGLDPDEVILEPGSSWRVLDAAEREHRASDTLFVVGRERSRIGQVLFGSVCRWLVSRGECDVLLV